MEPVQRQTQHAPLIWLPNTSMCLLIHQAIRYSNLTDMPSQSWGKLRSNTGSKQWIMKHNKTIQLENKWRGCRKALLDPRYPLKGAAVLMKSSGLYGYGRESFGTASVDLMSRGRELTSVMHRYLHLYRNGGLHHTHTVPLPSSTEGGPRVQFAEGFDVWKKHRFIVCCLLFVVVGVVAFASHVSHVGWPAAAVKKSLQSGRLCSWGSNNPSLNLPSSTTSLQSPIVGFPSSCFYSNGDPRTPDYDVGCDPQLLRSWCAVCRSKIRSFAETRTTTILSNQSLSANCALVTAFNLQPHSSILPVDHRKYEERMQPVES